ncbi:MAG: YkgJ family cysteine cluster protein [Burkholderiales bacterium]|nr:YkgJ family cysteine cluster protein [Burkholderiales bacterium]MDE2398580.1 YkgJ family cysteine cluster protein [Burkholderiales bacterium]
MDAENPAPASPVLPRSFDETHKIRFECRRGIACWNACCSNIDISLTPYDVLRLARRQDLSTTEFLWKYTVPYEMEKDGIAGVKLKPVDGGTACRFMESAGCSVYADRPTACRYYPVALLSLRRQDENVDRQSYALVEESHCLGHREPREITVADYRAEQGLPEYDELARGWRQLILKKKSSGPAVGKPSQRSLELFFMACYDLDRFRSFVASEGFGRIHDLPDDEIRAILEDDVAAMQFAFRFLRQVLFGEMSIALHAENTEARRVRLAEQRARIEREAAERLAREEAGDLPED